MYKLQNVKTLTLILFVLFPLSSIADAQSRLSAPMVGDDFMILLNPLGSSLNIVQLGQLGLAKGQAKIEPWSGSYWPIHRGQLAYRYATGKSQYSSKSFTDNWEAFQSRSASSMIDAGEIDLLSPSEKYDLLVGGVDWTLTSRMWKKGQDDYKENGVVAGWTGICNGWAAISEMPVPAPAHSIVLRDLNDKYSITFYASDVKALLSYLWAESPPETRQAGHRCNQSPIERDVNLRPLEISCLDTNPMTWHLAITNRTGRYGKSFVMDSSQGPEVWNYPIASYDYTYFNPRTFRSSESLSAAVEPVANLTADRYASLRNQNTKFVVGVMMDVFHPALTEPTTLDRASSVFQNQTFIYDLELNDTMDIIGGEWYSQEQPDFLWTMNDDSRSQVREDLIGFSNWDTNLPMPSDLARIANSAAQRGKVLATIVEKIRQKSLE